MAAESKKGNLIISIGATLLTIILFCAVFYLSLIVNDISSSQKSLVDASHRPQSLIEKEKDLINKNGYQAIFLNTSDSQTYFAKITDYNEKFMKIEDIYYVKDANTKDISISKLGKEIHGPEDMMIIQSDKILYWENLKDSGQVMQAIKEYKNQ